MVRQDGDTWSSWSMVEPMEGPSERTRELAKIAELSTVESWNCGRISSTSATNLPGVEDLEQGMAIEVDPDEGAGDAALVARVRPHVRAAHGVDGSLLSVMPLARAFLSTYSHS